MTAGCIKHGTRSGGIHGTLTAGQAPGGSGTGGPGTPGADGVGAANLSFREGAVDAGPVVFGTWAGLMAQVALLRAAAGGTVVGSIWFDNSVTGTMTIPAGAHDVTGLIFITVGGDQAGAAGIGSVPVDIAAGATLIGLREVRGNVFLRNQDLVTSPITDLGNAETFVLRDGASVNAAAGAAPCISLSALAAGEFVSIDVNNISSLGDSLGPALNVPTVGSFASILLGIQAIVNAGAIQSPAGAFVLPTFVSKSYFFGRVQAGFLGTLLPNLQADVRMDIKTPPSIGDIPLQMNDVALLDPSVGPDIGGGVTIRQDLPPIATAGERTEGMMVAVVNTSNVNGLVVAPDGADTIAGVAGDRAVMRSGHILAMSDGIGDWQILSEVPQEQSARRIAVVSSTTTAFANYLTLTVPAGFPTGTYEVRGSYEWQTVAGGLLAINGRLQHNNATDLFQGVDHEVSFIQPRHFKSFSHRFTLAPTDTLDLDFAVFATPSTVNMLAGQIAIRKVGF